jgi:hypothetical protein
MFLSQVFAKKMKNPGLFFLDYGLTYDETLFLRKTACQIGTVQGALREYGECLHTFAVAQGISVEYSSEIAPSRVKFVHRGIGAASPVQRRSIVESHGGRLWFIPTSGRGATFQFSLPTMVAAHA